MHAYLSYFPVTVIGWVALIALIASMVLIAIWIRRPSAGAAAVVALATLLACFPLLQIERGSPPLRPTPAWLAARLPQMMMGWSVLTAVVVVAVVLMLWTTHRMVLRLPQVMVRGTTGI